MIKRIDPFVVLLLILIAAPLVAGLCFMLLYGTGLLGLLAHGFTTVYWAHVLADRNTWFSLAYSAVIGGASLVASLALALALQSVLGSRVSTGALQGLLFLPLTLAPLTSALVSVELLGNAGLVARAAHGVGLLDRPEDFPSILHTVSGAGIVLTHMMLVTPFLVLLLDRVARHESLAALLEVARMLGASPWQAWRRVGLPVLVRASAPVLSVYWVVLMGAYDVPLLVGAQYPAMMSVLIERRFSQFDLSMRPEAYVLATVYGVVATALLLAVFSSWQRRDLHRFGPPIRGA
jgi:putative spermidine/putrescine transport system permease protein